MSILAAYEFREVVANALVHRLRDVKVHTKICMFDDRIEIIFPGGLPTGISEQEYLSGRISVLRNPIIANVFYRLKIVEIFGTGILISLAKKGIVTIEGNGRGTKYRL